jgi:hypothetical protein
MVILIHELGHLCAMKFFNYSNLNIFFIPFFGGAATGTKQNTSQTQEIIILMAGPLPGIIIGLVLLLTISYTGNHPWLNGFAVAFIFINLLNLLPIYPLDGGRMLKKIFFNRSFSLSVVFLVLSVIAVVYYSLSNKDYFLLILAFFLISSLVYSVNHRKIKKILRAEGFDTDMRYEELTNEQYKLLRQRMIQHMPGLGKNNLDEYDVNSREELAIARQISLMLEPEPVHDMGIAEKIVAVIIWLACFIAPFLMGLNLPL